MNNCRIADRYTYRMTWSHDDGEYVGLCAEFPSLSWLAASSEKALEGIRKVATECVADMRASREVIPTQDRETTAGCNR